jgi:hypothetical protein
MRRTFVSAVAAGAIMVVGGATVALAQDASRAVSGGGISVPGWAGKADGGGKVEEAKLAKEGNDLHATTGPAIAYWNPANKASGNYTVKATFTESKYMNLNSHPHPYGLFIGGNDLGTDNQTYLYCAAYGNGNFIVRGFGPAAFQMNGGRGESNAAVHKAAGQGQPVTQEIALSVKGDEVTCSVNGTVVGTYKKADLASGTTPRRPSVACR